MIASLSDGSEYLHLCAPHPLGAPNEEAFFIVAKPTNRSQQRLLFSELKRYVNDLWAIEFEFYARMENEEYEPLYREMKERWNEKCRKVAKSKKIKYTAPNFEFFDKHFYPEECQ